MNERREKSAVDHSPVGDEDSAAEPASSVEHELDDPGGGAADDDPGGGSVNSSDDASALITPNTTMSSSSPILPNAQHLTSSS